MSTATEPAPGSVLPLMTGEEFLARYGGECGVELVKGRVVRKDPLPNEGADDMSTATIPAPTMPLMTAEEFLAQHGDESDVELVEGRVVRYPMPGAKHGGVCAKATYYITKYVMEHDIGRAMSNDTFIRTMDQPDTFRGADVCFISYARLPKDQELPRGPIPAPDLVVEVRSPTDRINTLTAKATEYLEVGVAVVVLLIPETQTAAIFRPDSLPQALASDAELTLPDVLPGFSVPLRAFFE